jgi:membrane protease YdiL (CAAX protease family)
MMDTLVDVFLYGVAFVIAVGIAIGLAFWSNKARTDRSANVGLYLLFGLPGGLLTVAGLALTVNGLNEGPFVLAIGLAFTLPLIRSFRKLLARYTPFDPTSPIDLTGLAILLALMAFLAVSMFYADGDTDTVSSTSTASLVVSLVSTMIMFVSLAYIAVGYRIWRTGREATERLGLRIPGVKTILIGFAFVVPVMISNMIGGILTQVLQPNMTDDLEKTLDTMTQGIQNPAGALLIGLTAGIGEELFFRGALQPRFGIVITAAAFALMHQQYELSWVLAGMFGIGILLGIERKRYGTVAAIVTHATMNIIAVALQIMLN